MFSAFLLLIKFNTTDHCNPVRGNLLLQWDRNLPLFQDRIDILYTIGKANCDFCECSYPSIIYAKQFNFYILSEPVTCP